jgi:NAD(P)-dependent dehydrogenase (short-subunit alcohol dehydrogenase family)
LTRDGRRVGGAWFHEAVTTPADAPDHSIQPDPGDDRRVALVTGANRGIGLATVAGLARLGHLVLLGSRRPERGEEAAAPLRAEGLDVRPVTLDLTDDETVRAAAAAVEAEHGRLDVLVNNAAVKLEMAPAPPSASRVEIMRKTFETNVLGAARVTLAMVPLLRRSASPRIVFVSSGLGSLTLSTTEGTKYRAKPMLSYNPSKTAVNAVAVQFANELRDEGFKVNVADPGYTNTDMTRPDGNHGGTRTPEQGAAVVVRLATLPDDGPTGGFYDERGVVPW